MWQQPLCDGCTGREGKAINRQVRREQRWKGGRGGNSSSRFNDWRRNGVDQHIEKQTNRWGCAKVIGQQAGGMRVYPHTNRPATQRHNNHKRNSITGTPSKKGRENAEALWCHVRACVYACVGRDVVCVGGGMPTTETKPLSKKTRKKMATQKLATIMAQPDGETTTHTCTAGTGGVAPCGVCACMYVCVSPRHSGDTLFRWPSCGRWDPCARRRYRPRTCGYPCSSPCRTG